MKTAELTGGLLDCWVAKAEGRANVHLFNGRCFCDHEHSRGTGFHPSRYWGVGGPIIERDRIVVQPLINGWESAMPVELWPWPYEGLKTPRIAGPTPLIAAMRAKVASVYGDEVPDDAIKPTPLDAQ